MLKLISSIKISVVLFIIFACACAIATFIESKYGTSTAWALVYGTIWFGLIQLLLGINLFFALFRFKMYEKIPLFLFHVSFLFMLLGSALTRYYGFEGYIHIRESQSSNIVSSRESFFELSTNVNNKTYKNEVFKYISTIGFNNVDLELNVENKKAKMKLLDVILNAKLDFKEDDKNGTSFVVLNISNNSSSNVFALEEDKFIVLGSTVIANNKDISIDTNTIYFKEDSLKANFDLEVFDYTSKENIKLKANNELKLKEGMVISFENYKLGFDKYFKKGIKYYKQGNDKNSTNAYKVELSFNGKSVEEYLFEGEDKKILLDGQVFNLAYKPLYLSLPFSFTLDKFELERYHASNSPKSYASYLTLNDGDYSNKYVVFMNNVLDYKGFRFYQSSYDRDEKGTILSVNKDPGKIPTYIGYFLLGLGLMINLFDKKSRFMILTKRLAKITSLAVLIFLNTNLYSTSFEDQVKDSNKNLGFVSKAEHILELSILPVQKDNARVAPFGSLALDIMQKVHKSSTYKGMDATEVILWIMSDFVNFADEKFIYVKDKELKSMLKIEGKYASFNDFFPDRTYILKDEVDRVLRTNPNKRTTYDKEVLKVDERLNILYITSLGGYLRAFFEDNKALSILEAHNIEAKAYFIALQEAYKSNNYALSSMILKDIKKSQGGNYDESKFKLEVAFEKLGAFTLLSPVYLISGLVLLVLVFIKMIKANISLKFAFKLVYFINILTFIAHTVALAIRGYLSGHAPWSNSYESLLYIAWALGLSGVFFARKSPISLSLTSILAAIVLMVAHLSSIDPQIGNLAPVLQSYWLTIHVSVITASYGFLGLCALLGMFVLVLFCMYGKDKVLNERIKANIYEASMINEMAMILGLSLLTLGNFLGGVWANESWGRYWGWDSKETWALISILVYSIVLHLRLIKGLNNQFVFAVASMFAYLSIVMTYFGVNYFLSGMHSYAAAEASKVPNYVYIIIISMILLALLASRKKENAEVL